jgi:hypothetical protein
VPVAAERLDAPLHVQVAVDVGAELIELVRLVAVAQDHQVEPLGRRPGDLERHDRRASDCLRGRRRSGNRGDESHRGRDGKCESHSFPPSFV